MRVIADLQLHSRFARAVSQKMNVPTISAWAKKKGIGLIATGDWTHPLWFRELETNLKEVGSGVYKLKDSKNDENEPFFLLSTEVSSIYSQGGKVRRIHTLIFSPNFETSLKINKALSARGANLLSDGRPIVGLSAKAVAEIVFDVSEECLIIPAHAWTPHFSIFGSASGFDSIEECFGDLAPKIYAVETGLSSDPAMNWKVEELTSRRIVSFSDAHSPQKLGREATAFELPEVSYENVRRAIVGKLEVGSWKSNIPHISYTIEFYPEEGKYHYTGHRNCNVIYSPNEARKKGLICPVCKRPLTQGVASRVEELGKLDAEVETELDNLGIRWIKDKRGLRPPYVMMVPLLEIISEAVGLGVGSKKVIATYEQMINVLGSEFNVLLKTQTEEIKHTFGEKMGEAISKVRSGDIVIEPGYDGVFGKVKIWKEIKTEPEEPIDQGTLF